VKVLWTNKRRIINILHRVMGRRQIKSIKNNLGNEIQLNELKIIKH